MEDWYKINLYRLIEVSKRAASKYTRSKVRKALPKDFAYVIEELITERSEINDKESYYNESEFVHVMAIWIFLKMDMELISFH
ncbi:Fructose-1%2C6-bisphosphatase class 3 [Dorea longicatena]|nr:Fructose-1%2C6-bisphosphatase class 3 [Dorea longicatena]